VLVVLHSLPIGAQFDTAVVLGTVRDGSGAVVPAASITLKNTETGITASTISDENGNYQFLNVRIGSYDVSAELQGFSTAKSTMEKESNIRTGSWRALSDYCRDII
jgi:hypothetical protein